MPDLITWHQPTNQFFKIIKILMKYNVCTYMYLNGDAINI